MAMKTVEQGGRWGLTRTLNEPTDSTKNKFEYFYSFTIYENYNYANDKSHIFSH